MALLTSSNATGSTRRSALNAIVLIANSLIPAWSYAQRSGGKSDPDNSPSAAAAAARTYAVRDDAMAFADDLASRRGLDREWVRQAVGQSRMLPVVVRLMAPAPHGTIKNWRVYRSRFVEPIRIKAGVKFWLANARTLQRAEQQYGVPAHIIVGILGVETIYGQQMGTFRTMDALSTLAFDFPPTHPRAAERQAYFRDELEQFLSLTNRSNVDPMAFVASYAGAMGMPQFMPSSWVKYAVDFDGDGKVDLFNSPADAIGSVANYFKNFNWQPGMPTHYTVQLNGSDADKQALLAPDILPSFSVAQMNAHGAMLDEAGQRHQGMLALIELQNGREPARYLAGTDNFYAITRYNWSAYYAMAVIELGEAIMAQVLASQH